MWLRLTIVPSYLLIETAFRNTVFISSLLERIVAQFTKPYESKSRSRLSTLVRCPDTVGSQGWLGLQVPQHPVPLNLQGHKTGRMKVLFIEFQQETHENIPAQMIPTGKPQEHSCWRVPAGSWSPCSLLTRLIIEEGTQRRGLILPQDKSRGSLTSDLLEFRLPG